MHLQVGGGPTDLQEGTFPVEQPGGWTTILQYPQLSKLQSQVPGSGVGEGVFVGVINGSAVGVGICEVIQHQRSSHGPLQYAFECSISYGYGQGLPHAVIQ